MEFVADFLGQTVAAATAAVVLFTVPGFAVLRALGFAASPREASAWLAAPALGLCTYGPFSLTLTSLTGYVAGTLVLSWLLFLSGAWLIGSRALRRAASGRESVCRISAWTCAALAGGAAGWAAVVTLHIWPFVHEGGLFVGAPIFDHAKVAVVDAIARQGLPPINPYYAPAGETVTLVYYYAWHFLASQPRVLLGVPGWPAEVATTWFTGFATLAFLCALAMRVAGLARAGVFVLLLALGGSPADLLPHLLGPSWNLLVSIPPGHGLELLWQQAIWVPQHLLSALAVVAGAFLAARTLAAPQFLTAHAIAIGLTLAAAFGASTWVGGVGLALASPALALAIVRLRLPRPAYRRAMAVGLVALGVAAIVAAPLLLSKFSGPAPSSVRLPIGVHIWRSTRLADQRSGAPWAALVHVAMFWAQYLPLNLGVAYLAGLPVLAAWRSTALGRRLAEVPERRAFHACSLGLTVGYLLATQFFRSTFWNNTFGWRAVLVPVLLLSIWGAAGVAALSAGVPARRPGTWLGRREPAVVAAAAILLVLGVLSTAWIWRLPDPRRRPPAPETLVLRQGFLRQHHAWARVREHAGPADRVQANPDGYARLTPWPATLPWALFADRAIAYANVEYTTVFAHRQDPALNRRHHGTVKEVFSAQPGAAAIRALRDGLGVKVVLVDRFDPVWPSTAIEDSGVYEVVHREADFKIYRARP